MSGLISKSKVIETIKDYFKTIIDHTDDDVDCALDYNKHLCNAIERMPVDYDVDKVVERLEKYKEIMKTNQENCGHDGMASEFYRGRRYAVGDFKDILKGAVKDE